MSAVGEWIKFEPGSGLPLTTGEGGYLKRYLFWVVCDDVGWLCYGYFEMDVWYDETATDDDGAPSAVSSGVTHYCDAQGPVSP